MKLIVSGVLLLFGAFMLAIGQNAPTRETVDAKKQEIGTRVDNGDYSGFAEAATLPTPDAIRFLYILYNRKAKIDPARDAAAIKALREVPGYAEYFEDDMAKIIADGRIPLDDHEILSVIGSKKAQAVIAPYLFDLQMKVVDPSDPAAFLWNCTSAEIALEHMNIPGAPKIGSGLTTSALLIAWQKWAVANGLVPKDWISRVGAPKDWEEWDRADLKTIPSSAPSSAKSTPTSQASPFGSPAASRPKVVEPDTKRTSSLLVTAACIVTLVAVGYVIFRSRQ